MLEVMGKKEFMKVCGKGRGLCYGALLSRGKNSRLVSHRTSEGLALLCHVSSFDQASAFLGASIHFPI